MRELDDIEKIFYDKVVRVLTQTFGFDINTDKYIVDSGDNSVIMKGECAGHSLYSLKKYVADVLGKKVEYDKREFYDYGDDDS